MNLQGDFEGSFLTSILQLLCDEQNTGILQVRCGGKECKVIFNGGTIIYAQCSQKNHRLGALLSRDGVITEEQLNDALSLTGTGKDAIGKILLEKGYISLKILKEYNQKQVEEILYSILFWKKGKFEYKDAPMRFEGMVITQLNPMKVILEASRRIDEMSVLTQTIASDDIVFRNVDKKSKLEEFAFSTTEQRILNLVDEVKTVRDIIETSRYDEFTVYKTLYTLVSAGLIEKSGKKSETDAGLDFNFILSIYTDILKIISRTLAARSGERTNFLIRQGKENLPPAQAKVLQDFNLSSQAGVNRKAVVTACRKSGGDKSRQCLLLIDGFNGLCHHLLARTILLTDSNHVYDMIREIDKVLEYVTKYPRSSVEKNKIISDMKNVLNDTIKQVRFTPGKAKSAGFLSLFRKK